MSSDRTEAINEIARKALPIFEAADIRLAGQRVDEDVLRRVITEQAATLRDDFEVDLTESAGFVFERSPEGFGTAVMVRFFVGYVPPTE